MCEFGEQWENEVPADNLEYEEEKASLFVEQHSFVAEMSLLIHGDIGILLAKPALAIKQGGESIV